MSGWVAALPRTLALSSLRRPLYEIMVYVVIATPALVVNASFWSDVNLPPRSQTLKTFAVRDHGVRGDRHARVGRERLLLVRREPAAPCPNPKDLTVKAKHPSGLT